MNSNSTEVRISMSVIEEVLKKNESYAKKFNQANLPMPPAKKLAVVACMDARLVIPDMLGIGIGDIHTIRNAGGIVTEDAIRSLLISHYLLGTQEFMIINHTDCGMLTFKDEDLRARLERETGTAAFAPDSFYAHSNIEANVRRQIQKVKSHPWTPKNVPVRGFVFDVKTGKLHEVAAGEAKRAAA
jgi:carbonic anhydrase